MKEVQAEARSSAAIIPDNYYGYWTTLAPTRCWLRTISTMTSLAVGPFCVIFGSGSSDEQEKKWFFIFWGTTLELAPLLIFVTSL